MDRKRVARELVKLAKGIMARDKVVVTRANIDVSTPESLSYYMGCGSGRYDYSVTGIGQSEYEAYEDAIEAIYQSHNIDDKDRKTKKIFKDLGRGLSKDEDIEQYVDDYVDDDYDTTREYEEAVSEAMSDVNYYACIQYDIEESG